MAQLKTPQSYFMASREVQQSFVNAKLAAETLMADVLDLDDGGSEMEVRELSEPAFQKALDRAFEDSKTIPVQPDYLIASTAAWVWLLACQRVGFDLATSCPECPEPIPDPPMFNGAVAPSPEHEALIQEARAKEAEAANAAARRTREAQCLAKQTAQVNVPVQAAQASSSAGRCVQPGQGNDAGRGFAVFAPSIKSEDNPLSQNVVIDDGAQVAIKQERHADMWQVSPARGNDMPYQDQVFYQNHQENVAYVRREIDAQGDFGSGETEQSSSIMSIKAEVPTVSVPAEQAIQKIQESADKVKAAMIAGTTNQVASKPSRNRAGPDPVKNYFFKVDSQAKMFMQTLWDFYEFSSRYPTDAGYTCTGRPFEVKVHVSKARMFFGHKFCDREKVLDAMRAFSPERIYAHWEGDFAVIGVTTHQDKKWTDPSDRINYFGFLRSLTIAMNQLAGWARAVQGAERKSFAKYMEDWFCREIDHHGSPVTTSRRVAYGGKGKEAASADDMELDADSGAVDAEALAEESEARIHAETSRKRRRMY